MQHSAAFPVQCAFSITVTGVTLLQFSVHVDKMRPHPYQYFLLTTHELSVNLYNGAMHYVTNRQWCVLWPKDPSSYPLSSSPLNLLLDDDPSIVEFNDNLCAPVSIRGLDFFLYTHMQISLTLDKITDVQQLLPQVDLSHSEERHESFLSQRFELSYGLFSVTAIHPVIEPFNTFELLCR